MPRSSPTVRGKIFWITALAIAPTVVLASSIALQHVYGAPGFLVAAAWLTAAVLPLLTGAAAVIIVALAAEGLIVRWLVYLERLSRAYGRGRYSIRPLRLEEAPAEFREVGAAVADMASAIEERDHALRIALNEQSILLREVHHRVKNNLQIVGSLLSLQAARSQDPNVQSALREALVRIDTLALSQRFMKPTEDKDLVDAPQLFSALANQLSSRLRGKRASLNVRLDVQDLTMDLEFAARLVLIAGEAILMAFNRTGDLGLDACIALHQSGDNEVRLEITAIGDPILFAGDSAGISAGLIEAYARQVRGRLSRPNAGLASLVIHAPL